MRLFDSYIFVDWSAKNNRGPQNPTEDQIWVGEYTRGHMLPEKYYRTRMECISYLYDRLVEHIVKKYRVLLGFDFPYGYPKGLSNVLGHRNNSNSWEGIWRELSNNIKDTLENNSNRFEVSNNLNKKLGELLSGPFWGHPTGRTYPNLKPNSPGFPFRTTTGVLLRRLRIVESRIGGLQETWKLFGAGSVGSQALLGIPRLHYLRDKLGQYSKVWPFETKFTPTPTPEKGPFILHAEIWPGIVSMETEYVLSEENVSIKDQAQVRAMCKWASQLDGKGDLGGYFSKPKGLTDDQVQDCVNYEGWILGVC